LGEFCGQVFIGNQDVNPLRLTQFLWSNPKIQDSTIDGSLTVKGVCAPALTRIQLFNPLQLTITPNPVNQLLITNC